MKNEGIFTQEIKLINKQRSISTRNQSNVQMKDYLHKHNQNNEQTKDYYLRVISMQPLLDFPDQGVDNAFSRHFFQLLHLAVDVVPQLRGRVLKLATRLLTLHFQGRLVSLYRTSCTFVVLQFFTCSAKTQDCKVSNLFASTPRGPQ
jgi:hypothetical protein